MEFRLFGPLAVLEGDRSLELGRGRQRALFAVLLLHANEVVSVDRLIDEVWGESPPRTAHKSIQVYVSRLRKELGDGRLVTQAPGYSLRVERSELDLGRFEQFVAEADASDDPQAAAETLRSALRLWGGPPLADLAYEPFAQAEIARLEELRWAATTRRIDADLACGRHAELVGELQSLVAEHPHRERLRAQLMLALYRSGRQADALAEYRAAQRELSEDLGLEPGDELRALEQAILRHDKSLDPPRAAAKPPAAERPLSERTAGSSLSRRLLLGTGVLILGAAIAAAVVELMEGGGSAEAVAEVAPDSLAVFDPRTDRVVREVAIAGQPSLVAADGRSVWVASDTSRNIWRIDARRAKVTKVVPANALPQDLAATDDAVWVFDREPPGLLRVSAAYGSLERRELGSGDTPSGPAGAGVADGFDAIWVVDGSTSLLKLDPEDARIVRRFELPQRLDGIAVGRRSLWAISSASASVLEIDPASGAVRARYEITSNPGSTRPIPIDIAVGGGAVWVLNANTPSVTRIDPSLAAVTETLALGVGSNPTSIATGLGAAWVALSGHGTVARIDAASRHVRPIPIGGAPTGVAVSLGKVWISVQPAFRSALASRGRTVRVPGALHESFCSGVEFAGKGTPDVVIVSDLPLQHGRGPFPQLQYSDAVRFVLERRGFRAGAYDVGYQSCDDSNVGRGAPYMWTSATCRRNARAYADTPTVVGMIGPFESPCASLQIPILNRTRSGPLAVISGSTTSVGLTHAATGSTPGEPDVYYPSGERNFARVVAADDVQGPALAVMAKRLGVKRLFVVEDTTTYGVALAKSVRATARKLGVRIAGRGRWRYRQRNFAPLARKVRRSRADGVFFGGVLPTSRLTTPVRDMRAALGPGVDFIAPDGFSDFDELVEDAGAAAEGMVVGFPIVPPTQLPAEGRRFVQAFEEAIGARAELYSASVAQATEVLLDAIAASDGTRASVTRNLFRTRVRNGILGDFELNQNGDTTAGGVTMYRVENGKPRAVAVIKPAAALVR